MQANGQKKKKDLPYYNNVQSLNIDDIGFQTNPIIPTIQVACSQ